MSHAYCGQHFAFESQTKPWRQCLVWTHFPPGLKASPPRSTGSSDPDYSKAFPCKVKVPKSNSFTFVHFELYLVWDVTRLYWHCVKILFIENLTSLDVCLWPKLLHTLSLKHILGSHVSVWNLWIHLFNSILSMFGEDSPNCVMSFHDPY